MKSAELTYMPVGWLEHHPENPRRDVGNIKELTASIRESGVMQNLTVVPREDGENGYWVVIGNRRLEAARAAGLKEVPVYISDMDHRTQLATMMAENMQRVDLTLVEQADGVQMMMDLGMTVEEVSRKTGLRKDTVIRRRMLTKYDKQHVEIAVARGGTLKDFENLEKIEDKEEREKLLLQIGTKTFNSNLNWQIGQQKRRKLVEALGKKIDQWATEIEQQGYVGKKQVNMNLVKTYYSLTDEDVMSAEPPKDIQTARYYWQKINGNVRIFREVNSEDEGQKAQKSAQEKRREWLKERMEYAEQIHKALRETRKNWLIESPEIRYNEKAIMRGIVEATMSGVFNETYWEDKTAKAFKEMTGVELAKHGYAGVRMNEEEADTALQRIPFEIALAVLWMKVDREGVHPWRLICDDGKQEIKHYATVEHRIMYEVLTACGYVMTDDEKRYMDGTHELYCRWREEE